MATHFERQLEELHVQIITMGSLCEKVISLSNRAIRGDKCIQEIFDTDKLFSMPSDKRTEDYITGRFG